MVHLTPIFAVFNTYSKAKNSIFFWIEKSEILSNFFYVFQTLLIIHLTWVWDAKPKKIQAKQEIEENSNPLLQNMF